MTELQKGRLHQEYYRNGENHRNGEDVSFADIVSIFGFRTVEIGKWVTKQEQQLAANLFFDALCDLMDILHIPMQVISLNGSLSLSFGKGGRKGAYAHYNSAKRQLSLAKNAGGGALAHEWFHAYDHFICAKVFDINKPHLFATEVWLNELAPLNEHVLNRKLVNAFEAMFLAPNGKHASDLMLASIDADKRQNIFYYARPQEIAARAFERIIQENPIKNAFLVRGTLQSAEAKLGLYPSGSELHRIAAPLQSYFSVLGRALLQKIR